MPKQDSVHANEIKLLHLRIDLVFWFLELIQFRKALCIDVVVDLVPNQSLVEVKSLYVELMRLWYIFTI